MSDCKTCKNEKPSTLRTTTIRHIHGNATVLTLTGFPVFVCLECRKEDIVSSTRDTFVRKAIKQYESNGDDNYHCDFMRF
jgi:hypothetical protein